MKLKLSILIVLILLFTGCYSDIPNSVATNENFILIESGIVYDSRTEIVYYSCRTYSDYASLTPFYSNEKELVTKDEYYENYK